MPSFNCIRCGTENSLDPTGYFSPFRGKVTCRYCRAVHEARIAGGSLNSLELAGFDLIELPQTVPKEVKDDYEEAQLCSQARAYKGVVTLCRRALQSAVESKRAGKTGNLKAQIDELSQTGVITSDLAYLAHGIRLFGNYGAHPQDDELKQVNEFETEMVFSLTGRLLDQIFK